MKHTVILGAGIGGIVASQVLKKAAGEEMAVTVVDRAKNHYYAAAFPFLMIGERTRAQISRPWTIFKEKDIRFINSEIKAIDVNNRQVVTEKEILIYDYLVIALGVEFHPETVPGLTEFAFNPYQIDDVEKIHDKLQAFEGGNIVLFISSLPYKCPPAPYEMVFLLDQFFQQRGTRYKTAITLVTPDPAPEPLAGPKVGQSVRKMMAEKNIDIVTNAKVLALEKDALVLDQGAKIPGDLFLGIPPHWTPRVLRDTDLVDRQGFVRVDGETLATASPGVFAIGDCAAIHLPVIGAYAPKAGVFAHYQAEVVARNIALLAQGQESGFRYTGKGA